MSCSTASLLVAPLLLPHHPKKLSLPRRRSRAAITSSLRLGVEDLAELAHNKVRANPILSDGVRDSELFASVCCCAFPSGTGSTYRSVRFSVRGLLATGRFCQKSIVNDRLKGEIDRRRSIEGEIDRRRSIEREKGRKKKKRKKKKKKEKRRKKTYRPRAVLARASSPLVRRRCSRVVGALSPAREKDRGD
ncbi:hypothetical protein BHE74_00027181, partial [Ensete ventricosum]